MQIPESAHLWALFIGGHGLHVIKRASLSAESHLSGTKTRIEWMRTNALGLVIRLFVNAAAFSYWLAHPAAATHAISFNGHRGEFYVGAGARYGGDVRAVGRQPGGLGGGEGAVSAKRNSGDRSGDDVAESSAAVRGDHRF
jgi:hypothetical protein